MENKELKEKIEEKFESNIALSWLVESLPRALTGLSAVDGFEICLKHWREFKRSPVYLEYWDKAEAGKGDLEHLNTLFGMFVKYVSAATKTNKLC